MNKNSQNTPLHEVVETSDGIRVKNAIGQYVADFYGIGAYENAIAFVQAVEIVRKTYKWFDTQDGVAPGWRPKE